MKTVRILLDDELHKQLKIIAVKKGVPLKKLLSDILAEYARNAQKELNETA